MSQETCDFMCPPFSPSQLPKPGKKRLLDNFQVERLSPLLFRPTMHCNGSRKMSLPKRLWNYISDQIENFRMISFLSGCKSFLNLQKGIQRPVSLLHYY